MRVPGVLLSSLVVLVSVQRAWAQVPPNSASASPVAGGQESAGLAMFAGASFFSRYELREGYDHIGRIGRRLGEGDGVAYRARLSLASAPIDVENGRSVAVRVVPQASGFWGDDSGALSDAELDMHEADVRIGTEAWSLQVGRFEMAYGEHLVIGNVDWHETGRAFDGARLALKLPVDRSYLDLFFTQVAEGGAEMVPSAAFADGDRYFTGVYAGLGPMLGQGVELDGYVLLQLAPRAFGDSRTAVEATVGSRFQRQIGTVTARAEAGVQFGKRAILDESVFAYQADADAMVSIGHGVIAGLGALVASGDDPDTDTDESWNQLYPTAHKFLGLMDVIGGRSNVASVIAKLRWSSTEPLSFAFDGHWFARLQTAAGVDSFAGIEGDAWMQYALGKGLGLRAQYGLFAPSGSGPLADDRLLQYVELQLRFDR